MPTANRSSIAFALAGVLALAGCTLAQDAPPNEAQPAEAPPAEVAQPEPAALPEAIRQLLLGVSQPGASGAGTIAVEGAVLPERPGLLRQTPYGEWAFVFMGDDGQPKAMVLLPCRQLERMVESVGELDEPAVRLTGALTVYDRVNYLLPTNYAVITAPVVAPAESEEGGEGGEGASIDPLSRIDPQLRDIAEALEAGRSRARSLQAPIVSPPATRDPASGQGESAVEVESDSLQEGDRLVRRRARLERQRGLWTLRFDQDADGQTVRAPLLVLPNSSLRAMEQSVSRYGDQIAFEVSGTVYRYGRQPYVLITMHFVQPLEGLKPRG
jgi:hypothetical protein